MAATTTSEKERASKGDERTLTSSFALSHPLTSVSSLTRTSTEPWPEECMVLVVKLKLKYICENTRVSEKRRRKRGKRGERERPKQVLLLSRRRKKESEAEEREREIERERAKSKRKKKTRLSPHKFFETSPTLERRVLPYPCRASDLFLCTEQLLRQSIASNNSPTPGSRPFFAVCFPLIVLANRR